MPQVVEVEFDGQIELFEPGNGTMEELSLQVVQRRFGTDTSLFLFVRETERLFDRIFDQHCTALVAHRHQAVQAVVGYEHLEKRHDFPPSVTVFHVLQWALGKHGFALDSTARSKANLVVPGDTAPLPREDVIGKFAHHHELRLDLTLRDFTNGAHDAA